MTGLKVEIPSRHLVYQGPGIASPSSRHPDTHHIIQGFVQTLLHGMAFTLDTVLDKRILEAIFIKEDSALLLDFRREIQHELEHLAANPPSNKNDELIWKCFLWNTLALIPFAYPNAGETIRIPLFKEDSCQLVNYAVELLPLNSPEKTDPMFAFGLTSLVEGEGPPIFTCLGTTFPGGRGFLTTLFADFTPNKSVGEAIYDHNFEILSAWFEGKSGILGAGISLAGGILRHILDDHEAKFMDAYFFNAPGSYSENDEAVGNVCNIYIFCHALDFVSNIGQWPTGKKVHLYHIEMQKDKNLNQEQKTETLSVNMFNSHALVSTGTENIVIYEEDIHRENQSRSRRVLSVIHRYLGPIVIYYPLKISVLFYRLITHLIEMIKNSITSLRNYTLTNQTNSKV